MGRIQSRPGHMEPADCGLYKLGLAYSQDDKMTAVPQAERKSTLDCSHVIQSAGRWRVLAILGHVLILKSKTNKQKTTQDYFLPKQVNQEKKNPKFMEKGPLI